MFTEWMRWQTEHRWSRPTALEGERCHRACVWCNVTCSRPVADKQHHWVRERSERYSLTLGIKKINDNQQIHVLILMKLCSHVFWRQITTKFVNGPHRFDNFKIVVILNIQDTISLIIFKNKWKLVKLDNFDILNSFIHVWYQNDRQWKNYIVFLLHKIIQ